MTEKGVNLSESKYLWDDNTHIRSFFHTRAHLHPSHQLRIHHIFDFNLLPVLACIFLSAMGGCRWCAENLLDGLLVQVQGGMALLARRRRVVVHRRPAGAVVGVVVVVCR